MERSVSFSKLTSYIKELIPRGMLSDELTYVKGVGPKKAAVLKECGLHTCRDLLHYFPRRHLDRSTITYVRDLRSDAEAVTVVGTVLLRGEVTSRGRRRFEVIIEDEKCDKLSVVFFNGIGWVKRVLQMGDRVAIHGKAQRFGRKFSMVHPEFDKLDANAPALSTGRILALYPGGANLARVGLTSRTFRSIIYNLFKTRGLEIPHILPNWIQDKYELLDGRVALRAIHFPKSQAELSQARERLKFEELFFIQLMFGLSRERRRKLRSVAFNGPGATYTRFLGEILPFTLTKAQRKVLGEIISDTKSGHQMNRLLQGDVGSGKTVVAIAAILLAVDSGYQGAFMVPTEVLAEQHYARLQQYLEPLGLETRLLKGGQRKKERASILADVSEGRAHVVVGTHAVIQEKVHFHKLALAVVDEQHRFGVMQRAGLFEKGANPHMLLMTATPIPRSLSLTLYGDLDISIMNELPMGRKRVITKLYADKRRGEMKALLQQELREGHQIYVVYPLVEESEKSDLKDAESGQKTFSAEFGEYKVDLVHGRMHSVDKDAAMERFKTGETDILVATTVIEVGVDRSNATVMVIEHAERFGLSQLHQLRGRVGRGESQSYCVLMADYRQSAEAKQRLSVLLQTTDGFRISDMDLKLRGSGEFFGTRQSGLPDLKIADITQDQDILESAREAATELLERDPQLKAPAHEGVQAYYAQYYAKRALKMSRVG